MNRPPIVDLRIPASPPAKRRRIRFSSRPDLRLSSRATIDWRHLWREARKYVIGVTAGVTVVVVIRLTLETSVAVAAAENYAQAGVRASTDGLVALGQLDNVRAKELFSKAQEDFSAAQTNLDIAVPLDPRVVVALPIVGPKYEAARILLSGARRAAAAGLIAAEAAAPGENSLLTIEPGQVLKGDLGWFAALALDPERLTRIERLLVEMYNAIHTLDAKQVPTAMRDQFTAWQTVGRSLFGDSQRLHQALQLLVNIAGRSEPQEYLLVFQNNDELRPTGGFMGSYMLLKLQQGRFVVTDAPLNGPYALRDLVEKNVSPPRPITSINSDVTFQDANWFQDAPTSSAIISELYAQARGFKPDGVIFITAHLLESLLSITGPIAVPETNTLVSADTLYRDLETEVESGFDRTRPHATKEVIVRLFPLVVERLSKLDMAAALRALAHLIADLDRGEIFVTSADKETSAMAQALKWDGHIDLGERDALIVTYANLGGHKSDRAMQTSTHLRISPSRGDWSHVLKITRTHTGQPGEPYIGYANRSYVRVTVPKGANLVALEGETTPRDDMFIEVPKAAKPSQLFTEPAGLTLADEGRGIEISHELGGTTFGFWSIVEPGETQIITLEYTVANNIAMRSREWGMVWQRQAGMRNEKWALEIESVRSRFKPVVPVSGWRKTKKAWNWESNGEKTIHLAGEVDVK